MEMRGIIPIENEIVVRKSYVCVYEKGNIITPDYITHGFSRI